MSTDFEKGLRKTIDLSVRSREFTVDALKSAMQDFLSGKSQRKGKVGIAVGVAMKFVMKMRAANKKKFRQGTEYGSAVWGTEKDIEPYMDFKGKDNNVILTQTEGLTMGKPSHPKYARNKNILVIGGSGSGKTRFFVKPNLMQMHSSYIVTDPKGTVLIECGKMLERGRAVRDEKGNLSYQPYRIKVFNTIDFGKSMHYNPFVCHNILTFRQIQQAMLLL